MDAATEALSRLADQLRLGMLRVDPDHVIEDANEAARLRVGGTRERLGLVELGQHMADPSEVGLADVGEREMPRGSMEQSRAEVRFEVGDEARRDRRREIELARRACEAAFVDDAGEHAHGIQSVHEILARP